MHSLHCFALIVLAIFASSASAADCLVVDSNSVKSDADGSGPDAFPPDANCTHMISCVDDAHIVVTNVVGAATATSTFSLSLVPMLENTALVRDAVRFDTRSFNAARLDFVTSELRVEYSNLDPRGIAAGGFTLQYSCQRDCSASRASMSTISLGGRSGTVSESFTTGAEAQVCQYTLTAPACLADEMVLYNYTQRPVYGNGGLTDPGWYLTVDPGLPGVPPGGTVFPNDYVGPEQWLVSAPRTLRIRASPATVVNFELQYECIPVYNCSREATISGVPIGHIISDADGPGAAPYAGGPTCSWGIRCPDNVKLAFPAGAHLDAGSLLSINRHSTLPLEVARGFTMHLGVPTAEVSFASPAGMQRGGFALEFECVGQHDQNTTFFVQSNYSLQYPCNDTDLSTAFSPAQQTIYLDNMQLDANQYGSVICGSPNASLTAEAYALVGREAIIQFRVSSLDSSVAISVARCLVDQLYQSLITETERWLFGSLNRVCAAASVYSVMLTEPPCGSYPCYRERTNPAPAPDDDAPLGAIIGGSIGGVVLLIAIVFGIVYWRNQNMSLEDESLHVEMMSKKATRFGFSNSNDRDLMAVSERNDGSGAGVKVEEQTAWDMEFDLEEMLGGGGGGGAPAAKSDSAPFLPLQVSSQPPAETAATADEVAWDLDAMLNDLGGDGDTGEDVIENDI